jgi:hypothetical protein
MLDLFPELVRVASRTVAKEDPTDKDYDKDYLETKRRLTSLYAEQLLSAAMRSNALSDNGRAIYHGHMALATTDYLAGNVNGAIAHLQSASSAPPSTFVKYSRALANWTILRRLLDVGEYNAVASFFEAISASNVTGSSYFRQSAADIRSGRMPIWYQSNAQIMPPPSGRTISVDLDKPPD